MLSLTQVGLQEGHVIQWNRVTQGMLKERQQYQRPVAWAQVSSYLYYLHIWNIVFEQRTIRISLNSIYLIFSQNLDSIGKGGRVTLSLNGGNFKGFLIQAVDGNNNPIGSFNPPRNGKCLTCGSNCDSITHTNSRSKNRVVATWNAPSNYAGTVYFRYSIATSYSSYWAAVNGPSVTIS